MNIQFVQGDIFLTRMQAILVGLNAAGRMNVTPFFTALQDQYPVFISDYRKRVSAGKNAPGNVWVWRDNVHWMVGSIVQETPQSAARLRYVETTLLNLYKRVEQEGLRSLAVYLPVEQPEWATVQDLLNRYLPLFGLPVVVYETYQRHICAEPENS
ncbi:MAG TPA: hypothetical protein VHP83_06470 [Aggregatilineaceae bacterium]|nr:hypothetical protein [Aggregatilineaceae bacterium]